MVSVFSICYYPNGLPLLENEEGHIGFVGTTIYIKTIHNTGMNHRKVELFERGLVQKVFDFVNTVQGFLNLKYFNLKPTYFIHRKHRRRKKSQGMYILYIL
jgi:hypothetical protein